MSPYDSAIEDYNAPKELQEYRGELVSILHKSQDAFEKQLSYISAGCLVLSVGFVKDVIKDHTKPICRWTLTWGWVMLGLTLLLNLASHLWAVRLYRLSISEIDNSSFREKTFVRRFEQITIINWVCFATLIIGIFLNIIFITINF